MVFVLDTRKQPQPMIHPAKARRLLKSGLAAVFRRQPFTLILKEAVAAPTKQSYRLKIDYGSRHTGLAILDGSDVIWLGQLEHRTNIKAAMDKRRGYRRRRRSTNLRHRKARFNNRRRTSGWLPPSLQSRVGNIHTWVRRLCMFAPIGAISYENVKFDTQLMQNEDIHGVQYQQGELAGYEVREYLLEKFGHKCAYCGADNVPLEIEHIVPKSRGGSNRISNLTIACHDCNQEKGSLTAEEFGYPKIQAMAKRPLKDAALVTAIRWAVYNVLVETGLPVECGSGGRTKYNRTRAGLPKEHYYDACCVGSSTPDIFRFKTDNILVITGRGRGKHSRTNVNASGFPRGYLKRHKLFFGFRSGDFAMAVVPSGKKAGVYEGMVTCRSSGYFSIKTDSESVQGINHKYFTLLQKADGFGYHIKERSAASYPCLKAGFPQRRNGEVIKGNHRYLNELGVSSKDTCIFNTKETENGKTTGRTKKFSEQRKTYGFDERETWALNYTLITWLYSHLLMYKEINIIDMDFYKFTVPKLVPLKKKEMVEPHVYFKEKPTKMTFGAAIDLAIEYMKDYILNEEDFGEDGVKAYEKGKTALKIVTEIFGALWW